MPPAYAPFNRRIDEQHERKEAVRRLWSMRQQRISFEKHWQEVARYCQPRLSRLLNGNTRDNRTGQELNSKLQNDQGIWASEVLANGMATGMASSSMPWFRLTTSDPDLREFKDVKLWLDIVQDLIYDLFGKTNFYTALKQSHLEMGVFGTSATVMVPHPLKHAVSWSMTAGEYWLGLGDDGSADTLCRRCDFTAKQLMAKFGRDRVSGQARSAYDRGDYFKLFPTFEMIEPNPAREYGKIDNTNMAYRSIYWEMPEGLATVNQNDGGYGYSDALAAQGAADAPLLSYSGYRDVPFWGPRWDVTGSDVYGRSPGMNALPTLRALQLKELRGQQAEDFMVRPALYGPTALNNTHAALIPGGVTTMFGPDKQNFGAIWEVHPQALQMMEQRVLRLEQKVERTFYANLFLAITQMPGVQPRNIEEITRRNEEALSQLGPAVNRNHNEQLRISINRAFTILSDQGEIPPAPEELHGVELKVEFTSILAQMQRAAGLAGIERFFSFAGSIAGEDPRVLDGINRDEALRDYGDRVGVPAKIILSDKELQALRAARQQQEQSAQMAAMAPAALDGAKAAKVLADTQMQAQTPA